MRFSLWLPVIGGLLLGLAREARAQSSAEPYASYRYDSTFVIGGYNINRTWLVDEVADSLGFNTFAFYDAPTNIDSATVAQCCDASHPDSSNRRLRELVDANAQRAKPLRLLFTPTFIGTIGKRATAVESYAGNDASVVQVSTVSRPDTVGALDNLLLDRHFVYSFTLPSISPASSHILAKDPVFTYKAFTRPETMAHLYTSADSLGRAKPAADSRGSTRPRASRSKA